jgi:pSer/pThr/pTyr-binding forkhead associated (FHA) protein
MNGQTPLIQEPTVTLSDSAPMVRVTAGIGSAGQKTWNLRRPVTLIGSSRPAHIVLHDKDISKAHCVIVNTGTEVLLKDLRTSSGTKVNRNPVNLAVLADGDVITIGENNIQVAINLPEGAADDSSFGLEFVDPVKFPKPLDIRLIHTEQQWLIDEAIVLIGRAEKALIRLDHDDVSLRHAVIFRFGDRPAVFDLGARNGVWVNGKRCSIAMLADGDCLTVGPFGLSIGSPELALLRQSVPPASQDGSDPIMDAVYPRPVGEAEASGSSPSASTQSPSAGHANHSTGEGSSSTAGASGAVETTGQDGQAHGKERDGSLNSAIGETWDRLNAWKSKAAPEGSADGTGSERTSAQAAEAERLATWHSELDARDAALRGQLHDVTQLHEKVLEREREVDRMVSELHGGREKLKQTKAALAEKKAELEQREADVQRRESALAQRWTRLRSATCPHCGKPVNVNQVAGNGG